MEELSIRPTVQIVSMVGDVFKKVDMLDKYEKLKRKYPPPKWEYRYVKGKRVKIRTKNHEETDTDNQVSNSDTEASSDSFELQENVDVKIDDTGEEDNLYLSENTGSPETD